MPSTVLWLQPWLNYPYCISSCIICQLSHCFPTDQAITTCRRFIRFQLPHTGTIHFAMHQSRVHFVVHLFPLESNIIQNKTHKKKNCKAQFPPWKSAECAAITSGHSLRNKTMLIHGIHYSIANKQRQLHIDSASTTTRVIMAHVRFS